MEGILGNHNMHVKQNILFANETKQYEICPKPKGLVQKILQTLPLNFVKGVNKSWLKYHPFCMNESY